jgi:hypothetical protein
MLANNIRRINAEGSEDDEFDPNYAINKCCDRVDLLNWKRRIAFQS